MATNAMKLKEYAQMLNELADDWDGDEDPVVLVGDVSGDFSITSKDGYTELANVGYAQEVFDGNGVHSLSKADTRFFGAVMLPPSELADETAEQIADE